MSGPLRLLLGRSARPIRVALLALLALVFALAPAAVARTLAAQVTVTRRALTPPLPGGYAGLAIEYSTVPRWFGSPSAPDPLLAELLAGIDPGGRPVIRIGGQSTDRTWWPVPGMARPPGITFTLSPSWTARVKGFAESTRGRLMLGIDLEAHSARLERVEAAQLVQRIGASAIAALELGNEPPLYAHIPWYRVLDHRYLPWYSHTGVPVFGRPLSWGPSQFASEFAQAMKLLPPLPLAGPESSDAPWLDAVEPLAGSGGERVRVLTSHAYGLNQCIKTPSLPGYPTVPHLLSLTASRALVPGLDSYIAFAHAHGEQYRIDEMGSVSCNGRRGVSDTMASALWVIDSLFALRAAGIDGVNLHTFPGSANGLFDLSQDTKGNWSAIVHPLYYGALLFASAAPPGSRLLHLRVRRGAPPLREWATRDRAGRLRVVLINDSLRSAASVRVGLPEGFVTGAGGSTGALVRLLAHSAYATTGVTLGGQGFPSGTTSGTLLPGVAATVPERLGGYAVWLPPSSAALLTVTPAGPARAARRLAMSRGSGSSPAA